MYEYGKFEMGKAEALFMNERFIILNMGFIYM